MTKFGSRPSILGLALAISVIGWLALLSATHLSQPVLAGKQAVFLILGFLCAVGISRCDYRKLYRWAFAPYLVSLGLLALVSVVGVTRNGSKRWIDLGFVTLQPSELTKLALVIILARFISSASPNWAQPKSSYPLTAQAFVVGGLPILLIACQPDLGTSLVLVAIVYLMLFCFGGSLLLLLGSVVAVAGGLPPYLKDYQIQRIVTFLNPESDPLGVGYNLAQAKAAISSGGTWGLGLFSGPLTQSHFVPENETDFIFTVIGEELGFMGTFGLITLFLTLLCTILQIASLCPDRFGASLCVGIAGVLAFPILVNLAMALGLAPAVGLPLPFCSYGGSAVLTTMLSLGLATSVARAPGLAATRYRQRDHT